MLFEKIKDRWFKIKGNYYEDNIRIFDNNKLKEDNMFDLLRKYNRAYRDEMLDFTQKLIRNPSPSTNEKEVAQLIKIKMEELGYDEVVQDDAGNIIGLLLGKSNTPNLLLNSHMDTLIHGDEKEWKIPPCAGKYKNERIYGVGAADCKSGLAAQIYAGYILKKALLPLEGNLIVAATVAEENGVSLGVQHLIEETLQDMNLEPDYAILGEPTDLGIYYGHDGWAEMNIEIDGDKQERYKKEILYDLKQNFSSSNLEDNTFSIKSPSKEDEKIDFVRKIGEDENFGEVQKGIEQQAFDRLMNLEKKEVQLKVKEEKQELYTGLEKEVELMVESWETDPFSKFIDSSRESLSSAGIKVRPDKWVLPQPQMGTAGSNLVNQYEIPTIGFGPGNEMIAHEPNEYVEAEKISKAAYGTAAIIHNLIGVPVCGWASYGEI